MSTFKHSAVSLGTPEMPRPDVGSSIGPISLHNAIGTRVNKAKRLCSSRNWWALREVIPVHKPAAEDDLGEGR